MINRSNLDKKSGHGSGSSPFRIPKEIKLSIRQTEANLENSAAGPKKAKLGMYEK